MDILGFFRVSSWKNSQGQGCRRHGNLQPNLGERPVAGLQNVRDRKAPRAGTSVGIKTRAREWRVKEVTATRGLKLPRQALQGPHISAQVARATSSPALPQPEGMRTGLTLSSASLRISSCSLLRMCRLGLFFRANCCSSITLLSDVSWGAEPARRTVWGHPSLDPPGWLPASCSPLLPLPPTRGAPPAPLASDIATGQALDMPRALRQEQPGHSLSQVDSTLQDRTRPSTAAPGSLWGPDAELPAGPSRVKKPYLRMPAGRGCHTPLPLDGPLARQLQGRGLPPRAQAGFLPSLTAQHNAQK